MNPSLPTSADGQVPSPCTGICRLDAAALCAGCRRTLREIAEWPSADTARRREILGCLALRPAAPG